MESDRKSRFLFIFALKLRHVNKITFNLSDDTDGAVGVLPSFGLRFCQD